MDGLKKQLVKSVRDGDVYNVRRILPYIHSNIMRQWSEGYNILCDAIEHENVEIAILLVSSNITVNEGESERLPLHMAVRKGYINLTRMLLVRNVPVNLKDKNKHTCLYYAVQNEHLKIVKLLLEFKADVNMFNFSSGTCKCIFDCNRFCFEGYTPLHYAVEKKNVAITKLLIDNDADVNELSMMGTSPLHIAILTCNEEIVQMLLNSGAEVDKSPLYLAIQKNNVNIVKLLLDKGAKPNGPSTSYDQPLHLAIRKQNLAIVKMLLDYGAKVITLSEFVEPSVHIAAKRGNKEIMELLLMNGANPNIKNISGYTSLHLAVESGNEEVVKLLLDKDVDVNICSDNRKTPLHLAVEANNINLAETLIRRGGDVNAVCYSIDQEGFTPLHLAVSYKLSNMVKMLLYNKFSYPDIDMKDRNGDSPLNIAYRMLDRITIELLLQFGADIDALNQRNRTPFIYFYPIERIFFFTTCSKHLMKNKIANLFVSKKNLKYLNKNNDLIQSLDDIDKFQIECNSEVERLKNEKISNSNVSFYDILSGNLSHLVMYTRNEFIFDVLNSIDNYMENFPIYGGMIRTRFEKAKKKRILLDRAKHVLFSTSNFFCELPHFCIDQILTYVNDEDLSKLIDQQKKQII